ncbi:unnamed protein product [Didymodactylos carnosus]|uniref:Uncharacterized protein n=1 Tax=Didymodactylos carnosus TaxID=1234261 RepID=A0A815H404_9BILA|nr:unnamed protein product [Didymodactylos carnosus]CAF1346950.1 unnamed protein product [Didymodactylos carnosus]CAF3817228.1 unnamed protein product [Didymodactylos carnosus]CAF4213624.1 unnamed protein product [Didymodactylos carnosus]
MINVRQSVEQIKIEKCCPFCCECWCWCRTERRIPPPPPERETRTQEAKQATRVLLITIEYSKYSHPNTLSNVQAFSQQQRDIFAKERFKSDTLKFYLVNSAEFDNSNFNQRRTEAESLCRTVMQLKAMKEFKYPNDEELNTILNQARLGLFGQEQLAIM